MTALPTLRIAVVTETFPPEVNGVAMTLGHLVQGLRDRGHRVTVVRPLQDEDRSGVAGDILVKGLPIPGYPGLRFGLPAGRRLSRHWRCERPDLVHVVTEGPLGWSAVYAAHRLGIPVTSGFHTNFDHYSAHYGLGWLRPALGAYLRALHRRTRRTLVPTEALAAELAGAGVGGVRVVGRGVNTDLFHPDRRSGELRATWGVEAGQLACLFVGRLAPEKNLDLATRAFSAIAATRPGARMVWVGDGPSRAGLEKLSPDHRFAGIRTGEDLAAHYASADLFLFPSLTETYGNVVAEAMASGLPVLAYRSAAAAELISNGSNGMAVSPGDEKAFIGAAVALAADFWRFPALGAAARATIQPRSWDRVVERFESVAREALNGDSYISL
jgi:glycosyltransferase involved in cell wall biosynthesis